MGILGKIDEQNPGWSVTNNQLSRYINDKQRQNMPRKQKDSDKEKGTREPHCSITSK